MKHHTQPFLQLKVLKREELLPGAVQLWLETVDGSTLLYEAGQFLTFIFYTQEKTEIRRSYSICTSPLQDEPLSILVKNVPNGEISRKLVGHTQAGSLLLALPPTGMFVLPATTTPTQRICFLAAGSGIVPIFSMLKTLLLRGTISPILLIYSNRNAANTLFYAELQKLSIQYNKHFKIEYLFSESAIIQKSRLTLEALDQLAKHHELYDHPENLFYLCGPNDYMRMVTMQLRVGGIDPQQIKREVFVIKKQVDHTVEAPDKRSYEVEAAIHHKHYRFLVSYPETILEAARKNHIPLPYSCETGQCGTCAAVCKEGAVWMSYNEVIGQNDLDKGVVLTCTGHPVHGAVKLEF